MSEVSEMVQHQYRQHPFPPLNRRGYYLEFGRYILEKVFSGNPKNAEGKKMLEAGCGTGVMLTDIASVIPEADCVGIDFSDMSIEIARSYKPPKGSFYRADITNIDDLTALMDIHGKFDFIQSWGVLHHTSDPEKALKNLASLLNPNAYVRIGVYGYYGNMERSRQMSRIKEMTEGLSHEERIKAVLEFMDTDEYNPNLCEPALYHPNKCPVGERVVTEEEIVDEFLHVHERHIRLGELVQWFEDSGIEPVELTGWDNIPIDFNIKAHTDDTQTIKDFGEKEEDGKIISPQQAEILDLCLQPYWIALLGKAR